MYSFAAPYPIHNLVTAGFTFYPIFHASTKVLENMKSFNQMDVITLNALYKSAVGFSCGYVGGALSTDLIERVCSILELSTQSTLIQISAIALQVLITSFGGKVIDRAIKGGLDLFDLGHWMVDPFPTTKLTPPDASQPLKI